MKAITGRGGILALLLAIAMALAACSSPGTSGIVAVDVGTDGAALLAGDYRANPSDAGDAEAGKNDKDAELYGYGIYRSADGGPTWRRTAGGSGSPLLKHRSDIAYTAGDSGDAYMISIDSADIMVTSNGGWAAEYSAAYLNDDANRVLQHRAAGHLHNRELTDRPLDIVYDPASGNVIVAMGIQGVLVKDPAGQWTRVAVGPYTPTDFSASARLALLLYRPDLWVMFLSVVVSFTALALILPRHRIETITIAALLGLMVIIFDLVVLFAVGASVLATLFQGGIILTVIGLMALAFWPALLFRRWWDRDSWRQCLTLALAFALAAIAVSAFLRPAVINVIIPELEGYWLLGYILLIFTAAPKAAMVIATGRACWPAAMRQRRIAMLAAGAMLLCAVLPAILWLAYVIPHQPARWASLLLAGGIALALFIHLKRRASETTKDDFL